MHVISIKQYKEALTEKMLAQDVENYVNILNKSVAEFNSYGALEKAQLYATLAEFNIHLVEHLHKLKNGKKEEEI